MEKNNKSDLFVFLFYFIVLITSTTSLLADTGFYISEGEYDLLYLIPILIGSIFFLLLAKKKIQISEPKYPCFQRITPHHPTVFYPVPSNITSMEPVVAALVNENINVYSNLSKIILNVKENGILIEDKNFKNSILFNRRRSRRFFLRDGDIIDMGDLTLLYVNTEFRGKTIENVSQSVFPKNQRLHGKLLKNTAMLVPSDGRLKTFYLTKNVTLIGRSTMNDLVAKSKAISSKHAKIEKIAGKHKLIDLQSSQGTFVNGRRIGERYLRDGDEVAFESMKYRFSLSEKEAN